MHFNTMIRGKVVMSLMAPLVDIEITMENGVLTVKGERHLDAEDSDENYKRVERMNGTFYRRFSLPDTADGERIEEIGRAHV